jgi:NADP-dependent 3-hydroxy acid dehydrogenase YdfG
MKPRFTDKVILITGANGGLGSAFAQAFAAEGARLILAGRNMEALNVLASTLNGQVQVHPLEIADARSHADLRQSILEEFGSVDIVVNAAGTDVRKPFENHSADEIQTLLNINLHGAILLTQTFLPMLREKDGGMVVHVGGFADGRLAFPFYSVDAGTRAGLFTFIEAVNRELRLENSKTIAGYFSPSPAGTEAERPFHPIWREMGVKILPAEKIAEELLTMIMQRRKVHIMGGFGTRLFASVNAISPRLADLILLNRYSAILKKHLIDKNPAPPPPAAWMFPLGIGLVILSTLLYGGLIALPFFSIPTTTKLAATPLLIFFGEATFWVGGALLGKEIVTRYKQYLNPCNWFCKPSAG